MRLPRRQNTANQFKALRKYCAQNVVKKAIGNGACHRIVQSRFRGSTIPLPATMIHELSEVLGEQGTTLKLYSPFPFPNRADRTLDTFADSAWEALSTDPDKPFVQTETVDGHEVVRVGIADTMVAEVCVSCHNARADTPKDDWNLGDLRGVLEIHTQIDAQIARGEAVGRWIALALVAFLTVVGFLVYFRFNGGVVRPVKSMTTAMSSLADGDLDTEVPGLDRSDEIGAIAKAVAHFKDESVEKVRLTKENEEQQRAAEIEKRQVILCLADKFESEVKRVVDEVSSSAAKMQSTAKSMAARPVMLASKQRRWPRRLKKPQSIFRRSQRQRKNFPPPAPKSLAKSPSRQRWHKTRRNKLKRPTPSLKVYPKRRSRLAKW